VLQQDVLRVERAFPLTFDRHEELADGEKENNSSPVRAEPHENYPNISSDIIYSKMLLPVDL
jgi:hypothetical protein